MELKKQTLGSLREMLDTKQIRAAELCKEYSDSIKAKDFDVLGYITVTEDLSLIHIWSARLSAGKHCHAKTAGIAEALSVHRPKAC